MMWRTYIRKFINSTAMLMVALGIATGNANAGWVFISDTDLSDPATNPGYPGNENPVTVGAYVQDLLNLAGAPPLLGQDDTYDGSTLTGLGNPTPPNSFLLAFHFGNGNDYYAHTGTFDVFYSCTSGCDSFTLPSTKGISNYREYSTRTVVRPENNVPEPATLALVGVGLAGLGCSRRKR